MNNEEIVEYLLNLISPGNFKELNVSLNKHNEAMLRCLSLVNRDIPKTPKKKLYDYICCECNHVIYKSEKFCSSCGQSIKWK